MKNLIKFLKDDTIQNNILKKDTETLKKVIFNILDTASNKGQLEYNYIKDKFFLYSQLDYNDIEIFKNNLKYFISQHDLKNINNNYIEDNFIEDYINDIALYDNISGIIDLIDDYLLTIYNYNSKEYQTLLGYFKENATSFYYTDYEFFDYYKECLIPININITTSEEVNNDLNLIHIIYDTIDDLINDNFKDKELINTIDSLINKSGLKTILEKQGYNSKDLLRDYKKNNFLNSLVEEIQGARGGGSILTIDAFISLGDLIRINEKSYNKIKINKYNKIGLFSTDTQESSLFNIQLEKSLYIDKNDLKVDYKNYNHIECFLLTHNNINGAKDDLETITLI